MSSKIVLISDGLAFKVLAASILFSSPFLASKASFAQAAAGGATTSIEQGSEAHKALKMEEPSFDTREERLKAKPLDWNSTIGKPTPPRALSPAEEEELRKAPPGSTGGGAAHPNANEEARKLHPNDWR
jgi:hypothetical protein